MPIPRGLVFGSDTLDEPLSIKGELTLEPDGGYPDELAGRVELDLLIGEDGSVRWVGVAYNELDSSTLQSMTEKLLATQFSPPKVAGVARLLMIRIEIVVNTAKTQLE